MRRKLSGRRFATRITDRISPPPAAGTVAALALPDTPVSQGRCDAPGYDAAGRRRYVVPPSGGSSMWAGRLADVASAKSALCPASYPWTATGLAPRPV